MATSSASNGVQRSRRVPTDIHIAATRRSLRSTDGNAKGYASNKDKRITLSDSLAFADRAAVLIYEIGHCLLHFGESKPNLKQRELEAEATCFVVASHFGLNRESKFYLASYGVRALEACPSSQRLPRRLFPTCNERPTGNSSARVQPRYCNIYRPLHRWLWCRCNVHGF
jgi:hypothetical protein